MIIFVGFGGFQKITQGSGSPITSLLIPSEHLISPSFPMQAFTSMAKWPDLNRVASQLLIGLSTLSQSVACSGVLSSQIPLTICH